MATRIAVERHKSIVVSPVNSHNRIWPDLDPVASIDPGEELELELRDGMDGALSPSQRLRFAGDRRFRHQPPPDRPDRGPRSGARRRARGDSAADRPRRLRGDRGGARVRRARGSVLTRTFPGAVGDRRRGSPDRSRSPGIAIRRPPVPRLRRGGSSQELLERATARERVLARSGAFVLGARAALCGPGRGAVRVTRAADDPAARERRQPRRGPGARGEPAAPPGARPRRAAV